MPRIPPSKLNSWNSYEHGLVFLKSVDAIYYLGNMKQEERRSRIKIRARYLLRKSPLLGICTPAGGGTSTHTLRSWETFHPFLEMKKERRRQRFSFSFISFCLTMRLRTFSSFNLVNCSTPLRPNPDRTFHNYRVTLTTINWKFVDGLFGALNLLTLRSGWS